jgi:hypothetical protein
MPPSVNAATISRMFSRLYYHDSGLIDSAVNPALKPPFPIRKRNFLLRRTLRLEISQHAVWFHQLDADMADLLRNGIPVQTVYFVHSVCSREGGVAMPRGDELRKIAEEAGRRAKEAKSTEERILLEQIQTRLNELAQIEDRLERAGNKNP